MDSIVKTGMFTFKEKDYNFNFYTDLNVLTKSAFVTGIVDILVTEKHYNSVIRNVVVQYQLINVFTDVFAEEEIRNYLYQPESSDFDLNKIENFVNETQIVDILLANAKEGLIDELIEAVNKDIEYKTGIHVNPLGEAIASLLNTLESKVKGLDLDSLMGFAKVFKGMPLDKMTPEGIVDAYAKSDAFKKIREEADERNAQQTAKVLELAEEIKKGGKKSTAKKTTAKKGTNKSSKTKKVEEVEQSKEQVEQPE